MPVQMELTRIIISEINEQQVIYSEGGRWRADVSDLDRHLRGHQHRPPGQGVCPRRRPLTHDLLVSVVEHMGGELQDIVISELREHTYFAKLRIRHDGELIEVDSRPSDAIAVAVTCDPSCRSTSRKTS